MLHQIKYLCFNFLGCYVGGLAGSYCDGLGNWVCKLLCRVGLGEEKVTRVPLRDGQGLGPSMGWVGSHFPAHVMGWVGWVE